MARQYDDLRLEDIIPDSISEIKEIQNASSAIDPELLSASLCIREALLLSRIDELPENVIDLLAWQYHVDMYEPLVLPISQKRAQVKNAVLLHRYKGTPWAIKQSLKNLGFETVKISEWWDLGTLPHTFAVELYPLTEDLMRQAERCINEYKPVRSHMITLTGKLIVGVVPDEVKNESISLAETAQMESYSIMDESYPWPDMRYGDLKSLLKYGSVNDPDIARYSVYKHAESFISTIRHCFVEWPFAQHVYGEAGLLYNGSIKYGADSVPNETVTISKTTVPMEAVSAEEGFCSTIYLML